MHTPSNISLSLNSEIQPEIYFYSISPCSMIDHHNIKHSIKQTLFRRVIFFCSYECQNGHQHYHNKRISIYTLGTKETSAIPEFYLHIF